MQTLQDKLDELEQALKMAHERIQKLEDKLGGPSKYGNPGKHEDKTKAATPIEAGISQLVGGRVIWNDIDLTNPPYDAANLLSAPVKGYNNHSHGQFSGGALDINTLELVEYVREEEPEDENFPYILDKNDNKLNPHCQSYWVNGAVIEKSDKEVSGTENKEQTDKKGKVSWVFDPQSSTWGCSAYEIDVSKCYLVWRDAKGEIMTDPNGNEMKSKLLIQTAGTNTLRDPDNSEYSDSEAKTVKDYDNPKTAVIWDEKGQVWRFYACYAEDNVADGEQPTPADD